MHARQLLTITACLFVSLLLQGQALAAKKQTEHDGWALGIEQRTVNTSWYNYIPNSFSPKYTYETFNLLGVKGEYQADLKQMDQVNLQYGIGGTLFFIGDYTGERGTNSYSGDAYAVAVDAFIQAGMPLGSDVSLVGRAGPSLTIIAASAASSSAISPYDSDFSITIPEVYGAIGVKFDQFKFMGASSASLFYRFSLINLGVNTDYYIYGDPSLEDYSSSGLLFIVKF